MLWSYQGEKGGRDFAIVRNRFNGKFYILGTDLSISYEMNGRYGGSWDAISRMGSKCLIQWESEDLVHWSRQKMLYLGDETFGCFWAPDVIYDPIEENYIVHWSSSRNFDDFSSKAIYASRTRDFEHFTRPFLLFELEGSTIIDSAIYEENGLYYL